MICGNTFTASFTGFCSLSGSFFRRFLFSDAGFTVSVITFPASALSSDVSERSDPVFFSATLSVDGFVSLVAVSVFAFSSYAVFEAVLTGLE